MVPKSNHKCPCERETEGDLTHIELNKIMAHEGRVWSEAAASQGMPAATKTLKRQGAGSPPPPSEKMRPANTLVFLKYNFIH